MVTYEDEEKLTYIYVF